MVVACEGSTPLADLRRDLRATDAELASALEPLFRDGYLDPGDNAVSITPAGGQVLAARWPVQERVEEELFTGFTEAERVQFRSMLDRIQANCQR